MKIVLIHGQNHAGASCSMGRLLSDQLGSPEEQTEFFLPRDLNHFCTGCLRCLQDPAEVPIPQSGNTGRPWAGSAENGPGRAEPAAPNFTPQHPTGGRSIRSAPSFSHILMLSLYGLSVY